MVAQDLMNEKADKSPPLGLLRKDLKVFPSNDPIASENSWILFDPTNDNYYKIYQDDVNIISGLSENYTIDSYYDYLKNILHLNVTKDMILTVVSFLKNNGLMLPEYHVEEKRIENLREHRRKTRFARLMAAYLFFKVPIWNPDKFLDETIPYVRAIFNKWVMWFLILVSLSGYVMILVNWNRFVSALMSSLTYSGFIKYSLVIVLIKILHEFAHCYAAKHFGVRVRTIGFGIVFFLPRFYSDITDSWRIPDGKKRTIVDAAGILIEMFIGGIAAIVWINSTPGFVSALSYYLCTVALISTVLVNGNPFIRFDGYYILSDMFRIHNLQTRAVEAWNKIFDRVFLGIKISYEKTVENFGKNFVLIYLYGISAFVYRIFLYTSIVLLIYFMFAKALGIVLAILEIQVLFIGPIKNQVKRIKTLRQSTGKKYLIAPFILALILLVLFIIPLPWSVAIPCTVQSANSFMIYMPEEGCYKSSIDDGSYVKKGQIVAQFNNPYLEWILREERLKLKSSKIELDQILSDPKGLEMAKIKAEQIQRMNGNISDLERKILSLSIKAPFSGVFVLSDRNLKQDKWFKKGDLFGLLEDPEHEEIVAYAEEADIVNIYPGDKAVITLNKDISKYNSVVNSVDKVPVIEWEPSPLLDTFGGQLQVVKTDNYNHLIPAARYYQITLLSDSKIPIGRTGMANIRIYRSLAYSLVKNIISPIQKELTF